MEEAVRTQGRALVLRPIDKKAVTEGQLDVVAMGRGRAELVVHQAMGNVGRRSHSRGEGGAGTGAVVGARWKKMPDAQARCVSKRGIEGVRRAVAGPR